jgi:hypothetical protein
MSIRTLAVTLGLALGAAALSLAPLAARAAELDKELAAAEQHAGYAAAAKELKMVHAHLQHTINCLVGPKGKGFDANQLNPCKDMGNGAIADTKNAGQKKSLRAALAKARSGLKAKDLAMAQKDAQAAADSIKKAAM